MALPMNRGDIADSWKKWMSSTTLAECVCAAVFHGFVSGSMDTVQTAAEG
jgi:hypothetical protein